MENSLTELNDILFTHLRELSKPDVNKEKIERAKAVSQLATQVVNTHRVVLDAAKFSTQNPSANLDSFGLSKKQEVPKIEPTNEEIKKSHVIQSKGARRKCSKCKEEKSISLFDKNSTKCKSCQGIYKDQKEKQWKLDMHGETDDHVEFSDEINEF